MTKLFLFYIVWRLTGNPILAVLLLLIIYYAVDVRYIGFLPSVVRPFRRRLRVSHLRRQLDINPHDTRNKQELAQAYLDRKQPERALQLLEELPKSMQESADVLYDIGLCHLALGHIESGEKLILEALQLDNKLRYGDPYLKLGVALTKSNPQKAIGYLEDFRRKNFSSCECFYRLGQLYQQNGKQNAAKEAFEDCLVTYRTLPRFRKRLERRWALLARLKGAR